MRASPARTVRQGGYADALLRPTMVGILRCGKMLPPQLNLVIEIEFADATTALWSENAGAHPAGATLSTDFEIQNVRVLASQVVLDSALVESFNRVLLSGRWLKANSGSADIPIASLLAGFFGQNWKLEAKSEFLGGEGEQSRNSYLGGLLDRSHLPR